MKAHIDLESAVWDKDNTPYRRLDLEGLVRMDGVFKLKPESLWGLSRQAFHDISFFFRPGHLSQLAAVWADQATSQADRFVAQSLLKNALIASAGVLPLCQDTGTACVAAWRPEGILSSCDEAEFIAQGAREAYVSDNLRFSQVCPTSLYQEFDTGDNMPAQVDIQFSNQDIYRFLFIAKGGGSSNKSFFYQETKALLNPASLADFLQREIPKLGTSACPPYHLALVIGGTSPEYNLKILKLASAGALDGLADCNQGGFSQQPDSGIFRDKLCEELMLKIARESKLGAQFGGAHLALDARVIRLSRHAASLPISLGLSCNAHRNARAYISQAGVFLESLEKNPASYLEGLGTAAIPRGKTIELDRPMSELLAELSHFKPGDLLRLNGSLIVARDAAHARLAALLDSGGELPPWFKEHPVIYAGPAQTPPGMAIGSFGPTTAGRMDVYVERFMEKGASLVMIAKGNRSAGVSSACARFGACYLGTIGGAAALIAKEHILSQELIAYPELGMEAVRLVRVHELPAFVMVDSRGKELLHR